MIVTVASSITTTMASYAYFQKVDKALTTAKADVRAVVRSQATTGACVDYTCFAFSCLTCCCLSKCGQECLQQASHYDYWKLALAAYDGMSGAQVNDVFKRAMLTLQRVEYHLNYSVKEMMHATRTALTSGQATNYTLASLTNAMLIGAIQDGSWANQVMTRVRRTMVGLNDPTLLTFKVHDSAPALDREAFQTLVAAMGLMHPLCFESNIVYGLDAAERQIVRQAAERQNEN